MSETDDKKTNLVTPNAGGTPVPEVDPATQTFEGTPEEIERQWFE